VVDALNAALSDFSKAEFTELSRLLNKLIASLQTRAAAGSENAA